MRRHLYLAFLVLFLVAASGCQPSQKQASAREKVTIAHATGCIGILAHIAFPGGYFAEEGLDATPLTHTNGKAALQAVLDRKADLATTATTPIMFSIMNGRKLTILATIEATSKNAGIMVRKDHGIIRPTDLKGKKIAIAPETSGDFFAYVFLESHGVGRNEVNIIGMKPEEMPDALRTGRIDAASAWNPYLAQMRRDSGGNGLLFFGESLYTEISCLVAEQDFLKQHPEAIKKVLRALIKAEKLANREPAAAKKLVVQFVPQMDKAMLEEMWNDLSLRVSLNQSLLVELEDESNWAIKNGLVKERKVPNYLDFIYIEGLRDVNPEAVRISR